MADLKLETPSELMAAVSELREEVKKAVPDAAKLDKINSMLDEQEKKNAQITKELELKKTADLEVKERMDTLEKLLSRPGSGSGDAAKDELAREMKAFERFISRGQENLSPDEIKYLRTDNNTSGGYLAPAEYVREILKNITEISPIRAIARVRRAGSGKMEMPVRTGLVTATWEGEGQAGSDSNSTYGLEKLPLHYLTVTVPITNAELMDSAFSMETEINADVVEAFNQKEGYAFVKGTSVKQPEGILTNSSISYRASGLASALSFDSIIQLAGDLKTGYSPVYLMNRQTIAVIRTMKAGDGHYLWQAGNLAAGVPNQINGYTYVETPDMDDVGTNTFPIAFGDFRQGYLIGDSAGLSIIRDPFALKKSGKVEFTFTRRVGGQVVKAEAIKKLKCAVS